MLLKTGWNRCALLLALLLGSGCTSLIQQPGLLFMEESEIEQAWVVHEEQIRMLDDWHIKGRAAIKTPNESGSVSLVWDQRSADFVVTMAGPLGQSIARMEGVADGAGEYFVTLQMPNQEPVMSYSADQLLFDHTGMELPFQALQDWVRGVPMVNMPFSYALNDHGYLSELQQDDWLVEYQSYTLVDGFNLPSKIKAQRDETTVIVSIRDWQITKE